jgi:hypothetical protein
VEYATREQAQAAVAQLSNQSLMGRLVYVREVGGTGFHLGGHSIKAGFRIVRQNLGSSAPPGAAVEDLLAASALAALGACTVDSILVLPVPLAAEVDVRSMLLMFVPHPPFLLLLRQALDTDSCL